MRASNIAYLNLTPGIKNQFVDQTHDLFRQHLKENPLPHPPNHVVDLIVVTKDGTESVVVKGPSKSKKLKLWEYTIYIPDHVDEVSAYIDAVASGIQSVFPKYDARRFADCCKHELGIS